MNIPQTAFFFFFLNASSVSAITACTYINLTPPEEWLVGPQRESTCLVFGVVREIWAFEEMRSYDVGGSFRGEGAVGWDDGGGGGEGGKRGGLGGVDQKCEQVALHSKTL